MPLPWLRAAYRALPRLAAQEQLSWLGALVYPHATAEGGAAILARLHAAAAGDTAGAAGDGAANDGAGPRHDAHGRAVLGSLDEFLGWAGAFGLVA